jgi:hypothetical protein
MTETLETLCNQERPFLRPLKYSAKSIFPKGPVLHEIYWENENQSQKESYFDVASGQ